MSTNTISWNDCVKQSNNKPDLAQQLLDMLALELPEFNKQISTALKRNDIKKLEFHTHKLHGACCYCGANNLKSMLHEMENNLSTWTSAEVQKRTQLILEEIQAVATAIRTKSYK